MTISIEKKYIQNPEIIKFREPKLQFSKGKYFLGKNPLFGLQNAEPFDFSILIRKFDTIKVIVVCPNEKAVISQVEIFIMRIRDGIRYSEGIERDYCLDGFEYPEKKQYYLFERNSLVSEKKTLLKLVAEENTFNNNTKTCVLFFGYDERGYVDTESYYQSKQILLSNGLLTQYISINGALKKISMENDEGTLRNIVNNIYTKVGGVPWTLSYNPDTAKNKLVIGYAFGRTKRVGKNKYAPCSFSIFDKLGLWMGSHTTTISNPIYSSTCEGMILSEEQAVNLVEELLDKYAIKRDIEKLKSISIHKRGVFGDDEIRGFKSVLKGSAIPEYSLVSIRSRSNLRFLDESNSKGNVDRGTVIVLSRKSCILYSTGNVNINGKLIQEHKVGTPDPIILHLQLQKTSKKELEFLKQVTHEIFELTSLHWENVWKYEYRLPVTISYSSKSAKLVANGVRVERRLENVPWFI